jgi:hypothetical protein
MTESQMDNSIEFSLLEKRIMVALLQAQQGPKTTCLDPETLLDLVEQGDKHLRYVEMRNHIAACMLCQDEYALLNQMWREARNLPVEPPVAFLSPQPELLEPPVTPSNRPTFSEWLRGLVFGVAGARIAWGGASLILLFAGWTVWQGQQMRTAMQATQARLQTERADLQHQLIQEQLANTVLRKSSQLQQEKEFAQRRLQSTQAQQQSEQQIAKIRQEAAKEVSDARTQKQAAIAKVHASEREVNRLTLLLNKSNNNGGNVSNLADYLKARERDRKMASTTSAGTSGATGPNAGTASRAHPSASGRPNAFITRPRKSVVDNKNASPKRKQKVNAKAHSHSP